MQKQRKSTMLNVGRCSKQSLSVTVLVAATNPEYIIDEESAKQNAASTDSVQLQKLYAIQCKRQSKQIVRNPVLQRPNTKTNRNLINHLLFILQKSINRD